MRKQNCPCMARQRGTPQCEKCDLLDEVARLRGENEFIQRQLNDLRQDAIREFLYASPKYVQCRKENDTLRRQLEIAVGALSNISENPSCACDRILEAKAEHALAQIEAIGKRESS